MSLTTKSYDALLVELSKTQQEKARLEGEVAAQKETIGLLRAALVEVDRQKTIGILNGKVDALEAQLQQCLVRATAPPVAVPTWNGPTR